MKKKLLSLVGVLLVLALVAYVVLQFFLGSIVTRAVNNFAPRLTQTKVELAGAHISPLSGVGTLSGLYVGNPKGWTSEKAFYLGKIHVDMQPFSIFGDHIIVNEISIDQPEFVYETHLVSSNIGDLLKNIESVVGSTGGGPQATAKNGQPVKFEVKKFTLTNGKVTLGVGVAAMTLPMPPITLENLGTSEGGITPGQLAFAVMRSVTSSVVGATLKAAGQIGTTSGAAASEGVKKAGEAIKGLFGGKK
ncbi:MAG TPA: hypothetical protein VG838_11200 [Opitutaceae bacterium]|nr:hypothetical protein [Opitutaceae bacterium]